MQIVGLIFLVMCLAYSMLMIRIFLCPAQCPDKPDLARHLPKLTIVEQKIGVIVLYMKSLSVICRIPCNVVTVLYGGQHLH